MTFFYTEYAQYAQYAYYNMHNMHTMCMFDDMHNVQDNMQIKIYPICKITYKICTMDASQPP